MSVTSKKDQALAFISEYIVRAGRSPTMREIAMSLAVSDTRAKALVKKLAADKMIERAPGSQRAITVPGLMDRHIQQRMREMGGFVINDDFLCPLESLPLPQGHLPLVAIIDHIPATEGDFDGTPTEQRNGDRGGHLSGRARTSARRTPGDGRATTEAGTQ